ncbi:autotransporter outer membrane beta-barrel domain-containing protein [Mesorhizobium sp. M7A.F.Ca.US.010.02.1.1]|nr:autotransporter outer membrane beta-barrel domain-containing protein [Mesorhizobium sp. M7A.F.Ca.US.010.02.1.1]
MGRVQDSAGLRPSDLSQTPPNSARQSNLRSQASQLALRSAIGIAAAAGVSLLASGQAWADCLVGAVTVQCDTTSTTDTTFPADAPNDRNYQNLLPTPVIVTVDPGTTVSGYGLAVSNADTGGVTVTNNGTISVDAGNTPTAGGTAALSVSAAGGAITYTGGNIINHGAGNAFDVTQTGGVGSIDINVSGNIFSAAGEGITVRDVATSTGISVTTNAVTALTAGKDAIDVQTQSLTGNITEVANGDIKAGNAGMVAAILNASGTGNIDVTANGSIDARFGIDAENFGSGSTTVTTVGPVTATSGNGIYAQSAGAAVTVTAGDVTSTGNTAIIAQQTKAAGSGAVNVTAGNVSGTTGIRTLNNGTGAIGIITNGTVEGDIAAISAQSNSGNAIGITLSGATHNTALTAAALAITTSDGATTILNGGALTGRVELGGYADLLTNHATWTTGGTSLFGAGIDTVTNTAAASLRTASNGATQETTTFSGLELLSNAGRLTMQDGGAGDRTELAATVALAAGSTYAVDINAALQSDLLHTTGTATITGSTLAVTAQGITAGRYTVLTADLGLTGEFASVTGITSTAFLSVTDAYDLNNAYLDVLVYGFTDIGLTPNQIATGGGAESLGAGNPIHDALLALPTAASARAAFDQLSGEVHASAKGMLVEDSRFVRDAVTNRIMSAFGDVGAAALPVMAYGEGGPEMVAADTDRFAVWGQAFGSWGNTDGDGNAAAFDRSTGGLLAGADTLVGGWRVGLLGGYSHSSFDADDRNSSGKSDNYHLGLYGGTNWGAIAFRTGAAYSWSSLSTKRSVAFNGFTDGLSADYDAGTAQMFGELAYRADAGQFKFEPFANLAYVSVHTDGFTEDGGDAALTSAGSNDDATFTTLGLRGSTDFALGGMNATARGMLGWRHAFGDVTPTSSFAFAGGDQFSIAGVPIARDAAVIEAGLDFNMSANATLGVSYSGQFGGGTVDQGAKVDLGIKF